MPIEPTPTSPRFASLPASADWRGVLAWSPWLRLLLPLLAALVVGAAFQGSRGLMETSETRYAECAREMVATGDWMEPGLEFQPHRTKPPVAYWCMAAGMKLFGVNAWGARLPGVAALLLATLAVGLAGRRLWGEPAGFAAALVFSVGLLPFVAAYTVTTDIYLTAAEALAAAAFLFAATETDPLRRRRYAVAMWAAWGLGFVIKGPPALLPMLAFIPWNLLQPPERRVPLGNWRGLLAFVAVAAPWYVAMRLRHRIC
ncbi:MAG: glycosyltransferase family 39 protein [Opitutaceae bacterium]|nr:glycosyltransferase family 39 protein [Opitutaceae bacterium]